MNKPGIFNNVVPFSIQKPFQGPFGTLLLSAAQQARAAESIELTAEPIDTSSDVILGNSGRAWLVSHRDLQVQTPRRGNIRLPIFGIFNVSISTT